MDIAAELKVALEMLKERHGTVMSLLYDHENSNTYLRSSTSGAVTLFLQKHGHSVCVDQQLIDDR